MLNPLQCSKFKILVIIGSFLGQKSTLVITILRGESNNIVGIQNIVKTYKNPKKKEDAHTSYHYSANIVIAGNRYNQDCQYWSGLGDFSSYRVSWELKLCLVHTVHGVCTTGKVLFLTRLLGRRTASLYICRQSTNFCPVCNLLAL